MPVICLFILIYSISRYQDVTILAVSSTSDWYTLFTYNFVHTSFLHLLINSVIFMLYWNHFVKTIKDGLLLTFIILLSSAVAGMICVSSIPTIGGSALAFSLLGVYATMKAFKRLDKSTIKMYATIFAFMLMQAFLNPHINWRLHLASFIIASSVALCIRLAKY